MSEVKFWVCRKHGIVTREEDRWGLVLHSREHKENLKDFMLLTQEQFERMVHDLLPIEDLVKWHNKQGSLQDRIRSTMATQIENSYTPKRLYVTKKAHDQLKAKLIEQAAIRPKDFMEDLKEYYGLEVIVDEDIFKHPQLKGFEVLVVPEWT